MFTLPTSHFLRDFQARLDDKTRFPSDNYHPNSLIINFSERKFLNDPNKLNELTLRKISPGFRTVVKYRKIPAAAATNQIAGNARIPPAADLQKNKYFYEKA